MKIQCFFITYRVKNDLVLAVWCPTGNMIGDYMTRPLQGAMFRSFRDQIMGFIQHADPFTRKVKVEHLRKA